MTPAVFHYRSTAVCSAKGLFTAILLVLPGALQAAPPTLTNVTGAYAVPALFEWQLASSVAGSRGAQYDAFDVNSGNITGIAVFRVVLNSGAFNDPFWNTNQTWSDIFLKKANDPIAFASNFSSVQWYEGNNDMTSSTAGRGAFTISGNTLTWTAVPEPSGILAGVLMGALLLRRKRSFPR